MKKFILFNWALVALLALNFTACTDEPLEGTFPQQGDPGLAEEGQFLAQIDGVEFIASIAGATLTTENELVVTGLIESTGESITLAAEDVTAIGPFNLIAGAGTLNAARYFDVEATTNPYVSSGDLGGSGQLTLTELNTVDLTISGTFSFIGKRVELDASGQPVLDINGDPVIQTISVTPGVFNTIPYTIDDSGSGGGGGTGTGDPVDEFYALVEMNEFVEDTITTTLSMVGSVDMVKIVATTADNAMIRIDLPLFLGEGTFDMESISDGTEIIALYNSNTGGENLTSNPGTITITEFDTEEGIIEATFSFTGTDPLGSDPTVVSVTEGAFLVHFPGIPGSGPNPFSAEIDGVVYESETVALNYTLFSGTEIVSIETSAGGETLSLSFPVAIEVGSYPMSSTATTGDEKIGIYSPNGGASEFASEPGTLTITSYDVITGEIEGTFSYTAIDVSGADPTTYEITNGSFEAVINP